MKSHELEIPISVGLRCITASGASFLVVSIDENREMLMIRNETSGKEAEISFNDFEKALLDERKRNTPEEPAVPKSELIEEELRKKQEGKEYKDVGVRVSGARKETAAFNRLTSQDLGKLDDATAFEKTNKKNVLGEYDALADKEAGVSGGVIYMRKALFSAIPSKPSADSKDAREKYVIQLPKMWDAICAIGTLSELEKYGRERFMSSWTGRDKLYDNLADDGSRFDASDVFGKRFMNLLRRNSTSSGDIWKEAKKCESYTTEQVDKMYADYKENQEKAYKRKMADIGEVPTSEFREYVKQQLRRALGKKPTDEEYERQVKRWHDMRVEGIKANCAILPRDEYCRSYSINEGSEGDFSFLEKKASVKSSSSSGDNEPSVRIHDYVPLTQIERSGGREVSEEEIKDNETLIKNFGYKAVEYGNWVRDDEARHHVSNYIASMKDLEDVLGINIKALNKFGKLSVSFGSRGRAGMMAHYDLRRRHINLTKMLGDGSVAHEFGHFLDHIFASQGNEGITMITGGEKFRSSSQWNDSPMYNAMRDVLDAIVKWDYTTSDKYAYQEGDSISENSTVKAIADRNAGNPSEAAKALSRYRDIKRGHYLYLSKLMGVEVELVKHTGHTKFFYVSKEMPSKYWSQPCELFARAFETYIQDKLQVAGLQNDYLVADNLEGSQGKRRMVGGLYPQGDERTKIGAKIDVLVAEIRKELANRSM